MHSLLKRVVSNAIRVATLSVRRIMAKMRNEEEQLYREHMKLNRSIAAKGASQPVLPIPQPYMPAFPTTLPSDRATLDNIRRQETISRFIYRLSHLLSYLPDDLSDKLMDGIAFLCKHFERIHAR